MTISPWLTEELNQQCATRYLERKQWECIKHNAVGFTPEGCPICYVKSLSGEALNEG